MIPPNVGAGNFAALDCQALSPDLCECVQSVAAGTAIPAEGSLIKTEIQGFSSVVVANTDAIPGFHPQTWKKKKKKQNETNTESLPVKLY